MTVLKFKGRMHFEESWREGEEDTPYIDGHCLIWEIRGIEWKGPVTVAWADHEYVGELEADGGSGDLSEVTPGDPVELWVGPHDLLKRFRKYEDKQIVVWFADEPFNRLEDVEE